MLTPKKDALVKCTKKDMVEMRNVRGALGDKKTGSFNFFTGSFLAPMLFVGAVTVYVCTSGAIHVDTWRYLLACQSGEQ
jgi:hypothetical protein